VAAPLQDVLPQHHLAELGATEREHLAREIEDGDAQRPSQCERQSHDDDDIEEILEPRVAVEAKHVEQMVHPLEQPDGECVGRYKLCYHVSSY